MPSPRSKPTAAASRRAGHLEERARRQGALRPGLVVHDGRRRGGASVGSVTSAGSASRRDETGRGDGHVAATLREVRLPLAPPGPHAQQVRDEGRSFLHARLHVRLAGPGPGEGALGDGDRARGQHRPAVGLGHLEAELLERLARGRLRPARERPGPALGADLAEHVQGSLQGRPVFRWESEAGALRREIAKSSRVNSPAFSFWANTMDGVSVRVHPEVRESRGQTVAHGLRPIGLRLRALPRGLQLGIGCFGKGEGLVQPEGSFRSGDRPGRAPTAGRRRGRARRAVPCD